MPLHDIHAQTPAPTSRGRAIGLALATAAVAVALAAAPGAASGKTAFDGTGMWIWNVSQSSGGSPSAIVARARKYGVRTVYVKSGDAKSSPQYWSQFPNNVSALKAGGLKVCAWQYVYGDHPKDEAKVAARAIEDGADCFVIDAEVEYEQGKYAAARTYVKRLRKAAGKNYPIGLAGFPYTDYHPSFPYSVFLGPGGAQYNLPQIYWKEIGGGVDKVMGHTYSWNLPYGRAIYPLGQLYVGVNGRPTRAGVLRFRKYAQAEGAKGVSWWSWQHADSTGWKAIDAPISAFKDRVEKDYVAIGEGERGDIVYWAQEHLVAAGQSAPVDGVFGSSTKRAVKRFQQSVGLPGNGTIDTETWVALLGASTKSRSARAKLRMASADAPRTAHLPAKRYEIPPPAERHP
jgi:putative peptidoglycan binding protein